MTNISKNYCLANGDNLNLTRNGSFTLNDRTSRFKIISSVTGESSPVEDKKPLHVITFYDTSFDDPLTSNNEVEFMKSNHQKHCHGLHFTEQTPKEYPPHFHAQVTSQKEIFEVISHNQRNGNLPKHLPLVESAMFETRRK